MELTKDADKMICCIYKSFLQHRKNGVSKSTAREFKEDYFSKNKDFSSWIEDDLDETLLELGNLGLVEIYIGGDFELTDDGIVYMESRFKNNLEEITDFISKFLPW